MKGDLLRQQCAFSLVCCLPFNGFSSNFIPQAAQSFVYMSVSIGGIFLAHNISQFPLALQLCKLGCGWMLMRGLLPFFHILVSILGVFPETSCLENSMNSLQMSTVLLRLINNKGSFTPRTKYLFVLVLVSIRAIFLNFHTSHYRPVPKNCVHFLVIGQTLINNWAAKYFSSYLRFQWRKFFEILYFSISTHSTKTR